MYARRREAACRVSWHCIYFSTYIVLVKTDKQTRRLSCVGSCWGCSQRVARAGSWQRERSVTQKEDNDAILGFTNLTALRWLGSTKQAVMLQSRYQSLGLAQETKATYTSSK